MTRRISFFFFFLFLVLLVPTGGGVEDEEDEEDPRGLEDGGGNSSAIPAEENKWESYRRNLTALLESLDVSLAHEEDEVKEVATTTTTSTSTEVSSTQVSTTTAPGASSSTEGDSHWPEVTTPLGAASSTATTKRSASWTPREKSLVLSVQPAECVELRRVPDGGGQGGETDFVAEPGASLNISCLTRIPHEWSSNAGDFDPNRQVKWYDSSHELVHVAPMAGVDYADFPFRSTLHLTNVSFLSVGRYVCKTTKIDKEQEEDEEEQVEESTYLFVSDHSNPTPLSGSLAPSWRGRAEVGRPLVLPCRPSHPDHRVKLLRRGLDVTGLHPFSSRRGFVLSERVSDSDDSARLAGEYECIFSSPYVFELPRALAVTEDKRKWAGHAGGRGKEGAGAGADGEEGGEGSRAAWLVPGGGVAWMVFVVVSLTRQG